MTTEQFKQQILPFHAMMYGVAKAILESEDDACDAVQDSMMSLWQSATRSRRSPISGPTARPLSAISA